jgi:hypothetical protein
MAGGRPHRGLFDAHIGGAIRTLAGRGKLHAYGEMVGHLWTLGQRDAALELEEYWNELLARTPFSLFCGYPIDGKDEDRAMLDSVLDAHSDCIDLIAS